VKKTKEVASSEQCSSPAVISAVARDPSPMTPTCTILPPEAVLLPALPTSHTQPWSRQHPKRFAAVQRDARRRESRWDPARKAEELRSNGGLDALRFNISSSGWQGKNFSAMQEGRQLTKEWMDFSILHRLKTFERIPYAG
jgi:hypothetical protein